MDDDIRKYDEKIKAYMEHYDCSEEEADKAIIEIEQSLLNDFYGYSRYTGKQY